ncbi:unnamed protein product [Aspergillus oryzae RIB40]|uniref:DNA, SC012 n=1 Tax=Aspergillus oryzae (strain ATCC 42149 / RIB 40) TaxID=510516 RepID=Q2UD55_ASPOR|nr:unnamed protein product [Aspergillus oryzae RIB40]BAE60510.1 unnamed protein product [Aspergillus oryzae RIB40]
MLGEIPCSQGLVRRYFKDVAYCDQVPWLRNITIRQNIIGDSSYSFNEKLYDSVIEACALKTDFSQLPEGDQTIVGSNGVTLSGGQKQRITLLRPTVSLRRLTVMVNTEPSSDLEPVKKPIRPPMDHIIRRNKEVDATRQSGDTAVYAYYLRAVGWRDSIFLLILGAVSVFCDKFPSRSLIYNQ